MAALFISNAVACSHHMARHVTESSERAEAKVLGRALRSLRAQAGMTLEQAAARLMPKPIATQSWQRYEAGERDLKFEMLPRLAAAVGATYEDLMLEREHLLRGSPPAAAKVRPFPGNVPVFGLAAGGGERLALAEGDAIRFVPQHPAQAGYQRSGVAEVVGESMYPRYKPRELAYFVFDLLPPRGEDVIIEMKDGTALIKEYVRQDKDRVWLKEFYPEEKVFDLPWDQIKGLHAVVR